MHPYPHLYSINASAQPEGNVTLSGEGLQDIPSAPPPQFDGPGGVWAPETLLCASIADCFILTFRAVAKGSKFEWISLACTVEGTLARTDGPARFTGFVNNATLQVPAGADVARAKLLLEKAEHNCVITNSLSGTRSLVTEVIAG
jgi:organic hydroperoxide reductase OsmC/OhrA